MNETLPIPRTTLTEMVVAYRQSEQDIRAAFALLVGAEARLKQAFNAETYSFRPFDRHHNEESFDAPEKTMDRLKSAAWKELINKMGIRSAMSIQRAKELDEQLEGKRRDFHGRVIEPLPEITEANILAMMETTMNQMPVMLAEAVREVYDWLRPYDPSRERLVTQQRNAWQLGKRVIKCAVESSYSKTPFRVSHHYSQHITALDNVFHMLDGKGVVKTHYGPLYDAITQSPDGFGETEYFKFKCCLNRNLHIEFKRPDLVDRFNAVAGGMRLKGEEIKAA